MAEYSATSALTIALMEEGARLNAQELGEMAAKAVGSAGKAVNKAGVGKASPELFIPLSSSVVYRAFNLRTGLISCRLTPARWVC